MFRYPGEACMVDTDCIITPNCTVSGVCLGIAANTNTTCESTDQCNKGLFCQSTVNDTVTTKACAPQVAVGGNCTSTWDCVNSAACYMGQCTKYYYLF